MGVALGSVIEAAAAHYGTEGSLASPSNATATVKAPDGTIYSSETLDDDRVVVDIGVAAGNTQAVNDVNARRLGITVAQNQAGTGLVRCRFIGTAPGSWAGELVLTGAAGRRDVVPFEITVTPSPVTGATYSGPTDVG